MSPVCRYVLKRDIWDIYLKVCPFVPRHENSDKWRKQKMDKELITAIREITAALNGITEQMEVQTDMLKGILNELEYMKGEPT